MSKIRLAGVVKESIVDGPGIRLVVFTQGCLHECEGCHNPDTHNPLEGYESDTENILNEVKKNPLLLGVTFSGGEPFLQPKPLIELAKKAHELGLNVMSYTGYHFEEIIAQNNKYPERYELLKQIDILVDGPFILKEKDMLIPFRGSRNQRIIDVKKSFEAGEVVLHELHRRK